MEDKVANRIRFTNTTVRNGGSEGEGKFVVTCRPPAELSDPFPIAYVTSALPLTRDETYAKPIWRSPSAFELKLCNL
jgi:hypothetical protein